MPKQGIASYSKGMKQKILIGALLHDPDLLIFDEPDSGLDVTSALVMRHLIATLAARGKAILYTSHILDSVVEKLCTRVIVLHEGRVVADDSVKQLRTLLRAARSNRSSRVSCCAISGADRAGYRRCGDVGA